MDTVATEAVSVRHAVLGRILDAVVLRAGRGVRSEIRAGHDHVVAARVNDAGAGEIAEHLVEVADAVRVGITHTGVRPV
jgi:hydroxyethylthiazole kinase-like sugar kinase family protein